MAAEVGFLLVTLGVHFVRTGKYLPVDVFSWLAGVVDAVLGKFYTETVKGALVETDDETFYDLAGQEIEITQVAYLFVVY